MSSASRFHACHFFNVIQASSTSCTTTAAVSPGVSAGELLTSLIVLTAVYALLLVVEVKLLVTYIRGGVVSGMPELAHVPADENEDETPGGKGGGQKPADDVLAFAY